MFDIKEIKTETPQLGNISHPWYFFTCFLQNLGLRITESRKIIFKHIVKKTNHFSAEEVAHELSEGRDRVSRATVYSTLELIRKSGIIRSISSIHSHKLYEVNNSNIKHQHMKCVKCGKIIEFNCEELDNIIQKHCQAKGFYHISTNLVVTGLCRKCRPKLV